jgi:hypothetical protein
MRIHLRNTLKTQQQNDKFSWVHSAKDAFRHILCAFCLINVNTIFPRGFKLDNAFTRLEDYVIYQ